MSKRTSTRKPAGARLKAAEEPSAGGRETRHVHRSRKGAHKRVENLRDALLPAVGPSSGYVAASMPCYPTFQHFNPALYPPYNPPAAPPYMPLAYQYPLLPPIPLVTSYNTSRETDESSSESSERSPPPSSPAFTSEELGSAAQDVCDTFIDAVLTAQAMEVVSSCIEEMVKSYLKQSKLLIEPPATRSEMKATPLLVTQRHSKSVELQRILPSHATPHTARTPTLHPPGPATVSRPLTEPRPARSVVIQRGSNTRHALEGVDVTKFGSEAELGHHVITRLVDQLLFAHLLDVAMDGGTGVLVRVSCEGLLYDAVMAELLSRLT